MKYDSDIFLKQYPIAKRFIYHVSYYRELHSAYNSSGLKSEFWTHSIDSHLLQATIHWCMIFGSDGCQPTHWKKLSANDKSNLETSFRTGLFKETQLTPSSWLTYWNAMNDFRNQYVAHREIQFQSPVPDFTIALEVAFFYDKWIRKMISPDYMEEPPLKQTKDQLIAKFRPFAKQLITETASYYKGI